MNLSGKEVFTVGKNELSPAKLTTLNPNAAEFIPSSLKSVSGSRNTAEASFDIAYPASVTLGKAVLDRSESSISNNSDEEALQYWCRQLPDDITPDFKVMEDDVSVGVKNLSLSNFSLTDVTESPNFPTVPGSGYMRKDPTAFSPNHADGKSFMGHLRYPVSSHGEDLVSSGFNHFSSKPWDRKTVSHDQLLSNLRDVGAPHSGKSRHSFLTNMINDQRYLENADINPIDFLASQFPGFAAESLADVYVANDGDLKLTVEMFNQLELQVDGDFSQNEKSKVFSAPNFSAMDFPALSTSDGTIPKFSGDKIQQSIGPYGSSEIDNLHFFKSGPSISSRGAIDFASAVRKMAAQDSAMWKYDRNRSPNANVGSSRSSQLLASSYNSGSVRGVYGGDRLQSRGSGRAAPVWLETGEAVANMYSEMREDAREHARLRNAYFEQARQAYLVGNKALAKELSAKGQLHNAQMKAAHGKAQDSIYRLRNPEIQGNGRVHGAGRTIDLHGLHVSEALQVLKRELSVLRNEARSADQRLQVYICVGTGHHTRGSRTPARLPLAVQRYLLEEEGLDFSEPQPGLLQVVVY